MKKLYLVDVSSMFFRAFYAIRPLSSPSGMPVNAIYGFLSMTVKLLREIRPDYMAFCFDRPEPSFRADLDPNYKAHRSEMPEDLVPQVPYIRTLSEALGIRCFDVKKFEADDIIGTLTKFGRANGVEVVIVSGDKDFAQLIAPFVSMYDTMKDIRYDEAAAIEKWGVEPRKMIDYLSIVGDSSDNIPGVAGIGPKGAQKLLTDFESLEDIYKNLDKISSQSVRKKLEESREDAFLSKKLVPITCDVPLEVSLESLRLKPIVREDLHKLLAEFGFKTFAKTLLGESVSPEQPAAQPAEVGPEGMVHGSVASVSGLTAGQTLNPTGQESRTIAGSAGPANSFIRKAPANYMHPPQQPRVEVATSAVGPIREQRLGVPELAKWLKPGVDTWALHTERCSYLAQAEGEGYAIAEIAAEGEELGRMLTEKRLVYKGFDIKDFCKRHHVESPHVAWDQMLAAYVVRAGPVETPQPLFTLYNGEPLPDLPSASQILTAHLRLETQLRRKLTSVGGEKVLFEIEQPLVPILLGMERAGILIDQAALAAQSKSLATDIARLEKGIHEDAGGPFNIGSPKQLGQILFEKMKMPPGKKTKTGYSTDSDVLTKLAKEFPFTAKILEWRELSKLRSTYVDALPQMIDPKTGRVHTTFNQANAATGRLSSVNPNLQNIPIRTERGNMIRKAFVASKGHQLVSSDYSQIELRILAHITEDKGLIRAFESDTDVHSVTASEVFDVQLADVTPEMRRKAKAVNFGLAYGQEAFGLAEALKISRSEASEIITRYFARFPGVQDYMTATVEEAKKKGYAETIFGRRRYLDELFSKNGSIRKFGERAAINAPIQGTASDIVKMAMIKIGHPKSARMLLQVHDELVFEVESGHVDEVCHDAASQMEHVAKLRVPLKVNTGSGPNWDEAHS